MSNRTARAKVGIPTGEIYYEVVVAGKPVRRPTIKSAIAHRAMYAGVLRRIEVFTDAELVIPLKADGTEDGWGIPTYRFH